VDGLLATKGEGVELIFLLSFKIFQPMWSQ